MAERTATVLDLIVILVLRFAVLDRLHIVRIHERPSRHYPRPQATPHPGAEFEAGVRDDSTTTGQTNTIALSPIEKRAALASGRRNCETRGP